MPNNKSAIKRMRTSKKAQMRNKARKTELKSSEKNFRAAIAEKDVAKAEEILKSCFSKFDKASKVGVIHSNKACNKKSQLNVLLNSIR
jgi:small subunit ribosomal protein S20